MPNEDAVNIVWSIRFDVYGAGKNQKRIIRDGFLDEDFLTKKEFKLIDKIVTKHFQEISHGIRSTDVDELLED